MKFRSASLFVFLIFTFLQQRPVVFYSVSPEKFHGNSNRISINLLPMANANRANIMDVLIGKASESESLFSAWDGVLGRLGLDFDDLPAVYADRMEEIRTNSSKLFTVEKKGRPPFKIKSRDHREEAVYLSGYRSAVKTLQSDIERGIFFSFFDPSDLEQLKGLFLGFLSDANVLIRGPSVTLYIDGKIWTPFEDIVRRAIEEGHLQRLVNSGVRIIDITDIKAAFLSAFGQIRLYEKWSNILDQAFERFIKDVVSSLKDKEKLVRLYKSPYFRPLPESPYMLKVFGMVEKSDLSGDKDMILKWWEHTEALAEQAAHIQRNSVVALHPSMNLTTDKAIDYLKPYVESSFVEARNMAKGQQEVFEKAIEEDPFVSALFEAMMESESLHSAVSEIASSL